MPAESPSSACVNHSFATSTAGFLAMENRFPAEAASQSCLLVLGSDELVEPSDVGTAGHGDCPGIHTSPPDPEQVEMVAEGRADVVGAITELVSRIAVGPARMPDSV